MPGAMPSHKATILPRRRALGTVPGLPARDQIPQSYEERVATLALPTDVIVS